jgi:hypothetical protein
MTKKLKVTITAAGALALAGAGIAAGATAQHGNGKRSTARAGAGLGSRFGHPGGPSDDLDAAATYLGVTSAALVTDLRSGKTLAQIASATAGKSTAGLIAALVTHETAEINAAVTAGRLTQVEATTAIAGLTARFTAFAAGTLTRHDGRGGPGGPGGHGPSDDLDAAATYLGVTTAALITDIRSGKTLAQVATANKSTAGLIAALVTHEKAEHAAAVAAGKLTQAQADAMEASLIQRFTDFVNGVGRFGDPGGGHRH